MITDSDLAPVNPENLPLGDAPAQTPKVFSDAAAQAALVRLKAQAAAQQVDTAPPLPHGAVETTSEEIAPNPEDARRRFEGAITDLHEVFAE